jgi:hypothetical protein
MAGVELAIRRGGEQRRERIPRGEEKTNNHTRIE